MATTAKSAVEMGRTSSGYLFRIVGRGTLRESRLLLDQARQCLESDLCGVAIDLSECTYLDSTFLGCLVRLHKQFAAAPERYAVIAPAERCAALLSPVRLDKVLRIAESPPELVGSAARIEISSIGPRELGEHVMECHRQLAELEGPNQQLFRDIADRLAAELAAADTE